MEGQVVQVGERKVLEQKAYMLLYVRDQNNFIPKKPADAVHKETVTNFKVGLKGSMQNVPIERKSNGVGSHTSTKGNAVNPSASNGGLVKIPAEDNVQKADRFTSLDVNAKTSAIVANSSLANLNARASNGGHGLKVDHTSLDVKNSLSMKDSSGANLSVGEKVAASLEKATDSNPHAAANDSISTTTNENGDQKIINASVAELYQLTVSHFAAKANKCDPCKINTSCNGNPGFKKAVIDSVGRPFDSSVLGRAKDASISMRTLKVGISKLGGDSSRTAVDIDQKPELPTTLVILPRKKSAYRSSHVAVGKKFFKTPIMKMHLSTNIFFRKTLGLRKKKKHRGSSCNSVNKISGEEHLAVTRWDGVEVSVPSVIQSGKQESISIGYVGDEWDEDYDRGKQRKVRMNKINFDGSNPFQETASRRAKRPSQETASRKAKRRPKMDSGSRWN